MKKILIIVITCISIFSYLFIFCYGKLEYVKFDNIDYFNFDYDNDIVYDPNYNDNLIYDNFIELRFKAILNDIANFGNIKNYKIKIFDLSNVKANKLLNSLLSILVLPINFTFNIISFIVNVFEHIIGFNLDIDYGGGFSGGR